MSALYIVMVGLPARGKSTIALRLLEGFSSDGVAARIFNNGNLRRLHFGTESSRPEFFDPADPEATEKRQHIVRTTAYAAKEYLESGSGEVAIIDATNSTLERRRFLESIFSNAPVLYVECVNDEPELIAAGVGRKIKLPEFSQLSRAEATESFFRRIGFYEQHYAPLEGEDHFFKVNTLTNRILAEKNIAAVPHAIQVRDILVSGCIRELFLVRHGESEFNVQNRIGGDAPLTEQGRRQALALANHFSGRHIPYIFASQRIRAQQTLAPVAAEHPEATVLTLREFDELDAGVCDGMTYEDIAASMATEYAARQVDKYYYSYPGGEGYASMRERVSRGLQKALFLSGGMPGILIVGHQAVNRMLLSLFLFRRTEDVPFIYVPQNQYFRVAMTHRRKLFELVHFMQGVC